MRLSNLLAELNGVAGVRVKCIPIFNRQLGQTIRYPQVNKWVPKLKLAPPIVALKVQLAQPVSQFLAVELAVSLLTVDFLLESELVLAESLFASVVLELEPTEVAPLVLFSVE